jgi:hypothetical protein
MTGFTLTGQGAGAGNVLVGNAVGVGTWMPASTLSTSGGASGWTVTGNNVYETLGGNVGIGTNLLTTAALSVMNGNVGIGTWNPQAVSFDVVGGNVGIGTNINNHAMLEVTGNGAKELFRANPTGQNSAAPFIINSSGNLGIGTSAPDSSLEIFGGLSGFHIEDANAGGSDFGDLYTYIDSSGVEIVNNGGNYNFQTNSTPGPTTSGTSRLEILNSGNVGIGSIAPGQLLDVFGTVRVLGGGNLGIGSTVPGAALDVIGTARMTGFTLLNNGAGAGNVLVGNAVGVGTWMPASTLPIGGSSGWTVTGNNVYETLGGNVGIGTTFLTTAALTVMNGNVGIGTWIPAKPFSVTGDTYHNGNVGIGTFLTTTSALTVMNGNVGIGTWIPSTSFTVLNNSGAFAANMISNFSGSGVFSVQNNNTGGFSSFQAQNNSGTYEGLFGYGNASATIAAFQNKLVMSGSSLPLCFSSDNTNCQMTLTGNNLGIGTTGPLGRLIVWAGNVGIGTNVPGQALDVTGTVRTTYFTMSGANPIGGYVLTASDSSGDATWSPSGGVSGWTVTGSNVYQTFNGNVGIGTNFLTTAALTVMNGNVGIGTWVPDSSLQLVSSFALGHQGSATTETTAGQTIIGVNTGAARTITLATADTLPGRIIIIKDETGTAATFGITINCQGAQRIDGATSVTINANYGVIRVYSDGSNWFTF